MFPWLPLLFQVQSFEKFLIEKKPDIQQNPEHLLQIAANYSTLERIQQNARLELEGLSMGAPLKGSGFCTAKGKNTNFECVFIIHANDSFTPPTFKKTQ